MNGLQAAKSRSAQQKAGNVLRCPQGISFVETYFAAFALSEL